MAEYVGAEGDAGDRHGYVGGVPQLSGRGCSVCLGEFHVGQVFSMWPCGHPTHHTCRASGSGNNNNDDDDNDNNNGNGNGNNNGNGNGNNSNSGEDSSNNNDDDGTKGGSSNGMRGSSGSSSSSSSSGGDSGSSSNDKEYGKNGSSRNRSFVSKGGRPPVDYQGMDLTAFGRQGADAEVGASGAQRQERPVDPLRFEHLDLIFGAGVGVPTIQHAYEQIANEDPLGGALWAPPEAGSAGGFSHVVCPPTGLQERLQHSAYAGNSSAVYEDFPELLGLTESCFCHEPWLGWRGADGHFEWIRSAKGTRQGDPLEVYIIAYYLDDIHILGEPEQVREAYDTAVPLLADIGLELNVRKSVGGPSGACEVFQDVVDASGVSMPAAVVPLEGIRVLGIPVGSEAWVADQCFVMASTAGAILPKLARLNDPQEVAGSPYPLGEEAAALSQLPTRWGGLGLTSAQQLAPAGWLGSLAHVWKRVVVMFPSVRGLLPHLGAPEGTDAGGHPLVAGLVSAMEDVLGVRERVLAARAEGHVLPEALKVPEEPPRCGGVVDEFGYHYLACEEVPRGVCGGEVGPA
ncbi:hypothetical protein CYMTET_6094 [Cymbomonas tetramitiformis]|uniref:Uncharacterized protein n=1 Tax=Cymbomonas tetramitiformis TaxID=36881 RepID=A0AAE0GXT0_9CHLO|nr:hypothetical protein CYMTET_6094 [Cymbomonas tetramitiformis]